MSECANAVPTLRIAVESVRSRWRRDTGNLRARCPKMAFASPRLPSLFSKSIGLILWGIVDEPTSPFTGRWPT